MTLLSELTLAELKRVKKMADINAEQILLYLEAVEKELKARER